VHFRTADVLVFVAYFILIAAVAVVASRRERAADDYFLAGRNLPWWLVGISLIASNISTEHFIGMAGSGADFGLAIASYEWMAAVTLVIVARWFLPRFLTGRITTMPEYLERRFDRRSRAWLAVYLILAYVFVAMATVLFAGGLALQTIFELPLGWGIAILAVFAGAYTAYGGLKAVVWSDLIQGVMLLLGGAVTTVLALQAVGGWDALMAQAGDKFHTVLPLDHPELPWFAVFFGGLWIANLFYWGCNQFITQRTLAARSVNHGRYGAVFAAYLKLGIPFIIVIPGIAASVLFGDELGRADMAYPLLLERLLPSGLAGLMFAALVAAIMSSVDSMLNSTATIFTIDIYKRLWRPASTERHLIAVGRASTAAFLVIAALWAPFLLRFERVFSYIQEFWGLITPGVAVVFLGGLFWRRATAGAALAVMVATLPVTIGVKLAMASAAFLDQMWVAGLVLLAMLVGWSVFGTQPIAAAAPPPHTPPGGEGGETVSTDIAPVVPRDWRFDALCLGVVVAVVALYAVFF
jgi:SSS family solute:Na+ symporter